MQNVLYDKLRSGSTVSQLSHRYNVSKARIEAIRKLKDVEQEFKRQVSIPPILIHPLYPFYDVTTISL
jgi:hypothetical protein